MTTTTTDYELRLNLLSKYWEHMNHHRTFSTSSHDVINAYIPTIVRDLQMLASSVLSDMRYMIAQDDKEALLESIDLVKRINSDVMNYNLLSK